MKKRIVCLTLAILMCGSQAVSVMADRESDLREEQGIHPEGKHKKKHSFLFAACW